jgi:hypothetical protein
MQEGAVQAKDAAVEYGSVAATKAQVRHVGVWSLGVFSVKKFELAEGLCEPASMNETAGQRVVGPDKDGNGDIWCRVCSHLLIR